ncbi:MAG: PxKF domain-containing protein [Dehalococcoidia bacterium]|nr:PxKF domain-containing protein [Dehalococcoidia bacterium]
MSSSDTDVATVSPSSITFTSCGDTPTVTVTPVSAGSAGIALAEVSNGTAGSFDLAPASFTVNVAEAPASDTTAPDISYTLNPAAPDGDNGWYVGNVTLTWTVSEPESSASLELTGCVNQNITADQAATDYSCSATSDGGSAGPVTVTIKRDATPPVVTVTDVTAGASYYFGSVPAAGCSTSDALSGVATAATPTGGLGTVGVHTVTCGGALDVAGNSSSASATYEVLGWTLTGFFKPVNMGEDVWNTVKGGSTVPLKFRVFVGETELTDTSAILSFTTTKMSCDATAPEEPVDVTTTGGTVLRYDTTGQQFIQNWQTPKGAGCYETTVTTLDGSTISALFKTK